MSRLTGTLLFHLNLSYSSIDEERQAEIVERCYRPILELVERVPALVLALEASAHTLERIAALDPAWIARLRALTSERRIELVGSGEAQVIGPLVPAAANRWNQALGQAGGERLLGRRPACALVNEMAWSQGIVDAYAEAGYELLLMEWNNPRRHHPEWDEEERYRLAWTESPSGRRIALAWIDAIAFQKFQRVVSDDLELDAYLDWVCSQRGERPRHLFVYASDAEVFDFRPGRYASEPTPEGAGARREWARIAEIVAALREHGLELTTPGRLLAEPDLAPRTTLALTSAADPIPVKKQPKYNVTRWALSGRDDVGLNTRCFARARELEARGGGADEWRALLREWASDHRTHLTEARWRRVSAELRPLAPRQPTGAGPDLEHLRIERAGKRLWVETDGLRACLALWKGLALETLAFPRIANAPLVGTLPHGHFDDIDWAADFYSGHTVVELPARHKVTDLAPVEPVLERLADRVVVRAEVPTTLGALPKTLSLFADRLEIAYAFSSWGERPLCSLHTGTVTLHAEAFGPELFVSAANGGAPERLTIAGDCDHAAPVSALVSASAAFGATTGELVLDDGRIALALSWPPHESAALPLLSARRIGGKRFVRVVFSLSEIDETHRPGAALVDFRLTIGARLLQAAASREAA
jgi:hypothetical protein